MAPAHFSGPGAPLLATALLVGFAAPLGAQIKSPAERIEDLEKKIEDLEDQVRDLEKEQAKAREAAADGKAREEPDLFAGGLVTPGNIRIRLAGKAEFLFIDSERESDPVIGTTDEPDPHFEIDRFRLEPRLDFNREISLHSQIDFHVDPGRVVLKEITARHQVDPEWWFGSDFRIGLDDRFIRPQRRTKSYPLVGNAFWRDESVGVLWMLRFGDRDGRPEEPAPERTIEAPPAEPAAKTPAEPGAPEPKAKDGKKKKKKAKDKAKAKDAGGAGTEGGPGTEGAPGADTGGGASQAPAGGESGSDTAVEGGGNGESPGGGGNGAEPPSLVPAVEPAARSPFDFSRNLGELQLYLAAGNGYTLDGNEVGQDRADFNDLVQDDRNVTDDLSVRDLGIGLGWRRNFEALGEFEILGFYFNDEVNDDSLAFLQDELTLRDVVTGNPIGGYGDSNDRTSERYGIGADYFLSAERIFGAEAARANDGLHLTGQWIEGQDGEFQRQGWYVQGSYRWSFPQRLLFDRYFRSLEPVIQYGVLSTNLSPLPELPGTWDRRQLVLGVIVEVTGDIFLKVEYAFNVERTGGSRPASGGQPAVSAPNSVDNDELLIELLFQF